MKWKALSDRFLTHSVAFDQLWAEIAGKRSRMKAGDVVVIPPRRKHKFTNREDVPALTFSVYSPSA
ncbi:MAG: cupin domain-containing protein [Chthoniobacteraceae bacterium]